MKKIILILILVCIPAALPLILPGGYEPHDFHHIADIYEMSRAISLGQIPPRLGPDFMFGFGYPLFNYYYVLPFYLGAFFYFLSGSLMVALKNVFLITTFISTIGMYLLLRKFFGKWASLAGAILYMYTPYRAVEIYVRGAIGESVAIALIPWVFYVLALVIEKRSAKYISFASFVLMLFFITHNYFFILSAPFIVVFALILLIKQKDKIKPLIRLCITGVMAAGASAFWWLPAFLEYKLVASSTPFNLADHFPFIKQLIIPSWGYGSSVWGPNDEISFQIGVVNLILILAAIILLIKLRKKVNLTYKLLLWGVVSFFILVFMMNIRSLFIWNLIPFTNFIQFPWRLLAFTTFFTAFITAVVVDSFKKKKILSILIICLSIIFTVWYFHPSKNITRTNEQYVAHFFYNPQYSEDYLQLPMDSSVKPTELVDEFITDQNSRIIEARKISDIHWTIKVNADADSTIEASVLNFPGWFLKVDGKPVQTSPGKPYGQMTFVVSKGVHNIELYWSETNLRKFADFVSVVFLIVIILLYFKPRVLRDKI